MMLHRRVLVTDPSCVGEARRQAAELARALVFGEKEAGRLGVTVTELASNIVKHGGEGEILVRTFRDDDVAGVVVLALDRGPGIADLRSALADGHSTAGSPGTGLGAVRRLADGFEVASQVGEGTAVAAVVTSGRSVTAGRFAVGAVNVPHPDEEVSGDAWALDRIGATCGVLVADGLGHGVLAADAAERATALFRDHPGEAPTAALERIHRGLRGTRGAAVAAARIDLERGEVRFAGLGNIGATICGDGESRSLVSHHGTAGHEARRIQEFVYPWSPDSALVMHSDGLTARWNAGTAASVVAHTPDLAAALLYRDYRRGRDDATVVVVREAAP